MLTTNCNSNLNRIYIRISIKYRKYIDTSNLTFEEQILECFFFKWREQQMVQKKYNSHSNLLEEHETNFC